MYTNDGDLPSLLVHDVVLAVSLVVFFSHLAFYQIGFRVEGMSCKTVRLSSIYLLYLLSRIMHTKYYGILCIHLSSLQTTHACVLYS